MKVFQTDTSLGIPFLAPDCLPMVVLEDVPVMFQHGWPECTHSKEGLVCQSKRWWPTKVDMIDALVRSIGEQLDCRMRPFVVAESDW